MQEVWKNISDYEGVYQISNLGRIKRLERTSGNRNLKQKIRKQQTGKHGYKTIILYKEGNNKKFLTHRLVALSFVSNPLNKTEVNHKDGNKINNKVDNLEWVTSTENHIHAYGLGLQKISGGAISNRKKIRCKTLGIQTNTITEMQNYLVSNQVTKNRHPSIGRMIKKNKKYLGLEFQFI